jgi:sucrose-6-phosphate hydrolase SacC (GH32 family)
MTWGHAISPDLVHWTQLEHALWPDRLGTMFSGSAVVDWNNTAGFQAGDEKPLVVIYTAAGGTSPESEGQPFTQCIAYSNDRGRTFTKWGGNPALKNVAGDNRDPKVFWHEPTKRWVMVLYVPVQDTKKKTADGQPATVQALQFFASPNLKEWSFLSQLDNFFECPDMFELPVDGDRQNTRWVVFGANGEYLIGRFDGTTFTKESGKNKSDFGKNFYAAQTYSDIPAGDGRRILIGWMQGGKYPGMPFNQQMGFPVTLELRTTPEGPRLRKWPVKEITSLSPGFPVTLKNVTLSREDFDKLEVPVADLSLEVPDNDFKIDVRGFPIRWEAQARKLTVRGREATLPRPADHVVRLRLLIDRSSIETFANDGLVTFSDCFTPRPEGRLLRIEMTAENPVSLEIRSLKSAWRE